MAEILKCPNCNALLHAVPNANILKCEYCDTEIIINNNIQNFIRQINGFSRQENHVADMKKWNKSFCKHLIIQAVLSAFFGIFMEADLGDIGVIIFFTSFVYSIALPCYLLNKKPIPPIPNKNNKWTDIKIYISSEYPNRNNKLADFMKIYISFAGAFWGGMILIAIIVTI